MSDLTLYPADIAAMSVGQLAALPPAQKAEISRNLDEALAWLKQARAKFDAALEAAYGEQARAARLEAGKDFGVVHLKDGLLRVTVDVPKRVSWDQAQLAAIARRIAAAGLEAPPLRLALFEDLAPVCLAPLIARAAALPGLTLETRVLGFGALDAALRRGEADLALTWDLGLGPGVLRQVLARVPPHAVLPPDHPLAALPALRLSDLADQPLILADQGPSLAHLRALFTRAGIAPQVAHRTATLELMRSHAANGLGVGLSYTNPAGRIAPDGRPFVTRAIADAGAEPVILAQLDGNALPEAAAGLAPLLAALFTGPAFPDLVVP